MAMSWEDAMFGGSSSSGSRLGINYMRAQEPETEVQLGGSDRTLRVRQHIEDRESISGVVWDAGLLLTDFIVSEIERRKRRKVNKSLISSNQQTNYVLDLGCGTGIVGIVARAMSDQNDEVTEVTFSDLPSVQSIVEANMAVATDNNGPLRFIPYDWCSDNAPPVALQSPINISQINEVTISCKRTSCVESIWDTVYCSDLLYDENMHTPLLKLLHMIRFRRCIFGYKKRHHDAELYFWKQLSEWCNIEVLSCNSNHSDYDSSSLLNDSPIIQLLNCTEAMTRCGGGLFAVLVVPKEK